MARKITLDGLRIELYQEQVDRIFSMLATRKIGFLKLFEKSLITELERFEQEERDNYDAWMKTLTRAEEEIEALRALQKGEKS